MDLGFAGRTIVVTGASSGVGLATTKLLLAEGARVAACARDEERLTQAIERAVVGTNGEAHTGVADVTDRPSVDAFIEETIAVFGRIDAVVCNAGQSLRATVDEATEAQIRQEFDLKIFGALNVIKAAKPYLQASDLASIVNVNAILARQPEPNLAITSSARAALLNMTKSMAHSLGEEGIRINSVLLGLIDTGQWVRRYQDTGTTTPYEIWVQELAVERGIVLGRLGTAIEVAWPILSLLSPLSSYTTGACIDVGGGIAHYV